MIRIDTLGGLTVRGEDGRPLSGAVAQPRRMAILALIARAGDRGVSRDKLLALLWPDADDERGPGALAQALYALRRDLGTADAIVGGKDLRFDPELVSTDVAEFTAGIARGDDATAVARYHGPFLDGFHVPGADAFSRWVEQERNALAHDYARALESLARAARARGDATQAVGWWRKLAALDPLNARVTVGLMDALVAAGDRAGALKHVNVYQVLVDQELELPPDREVLAFAALLRQESDAPRALDAPELAAPVVASARAVPAEVPPPATPVAASVTRTWAATHRRARGAFALSLVAVVLAGAAFAVTRTRSPTADPAASTDGESGRTVAVGRIAAFGADSAPGNLAGPVADLLATSLARARGIHVVSQGRMLELMRSARGAPDTSGAAFMDAARSAGAAELIDGTLYARPGGRLRLDLRRIDVASGAIDDVHTTEGSDLFALVDSGTALVVAALGIARPDGSVADLTTRSATAYRMYERGIQAYYRGDLHGALGLFDAALAEDSLFAMAAYYDALAASGTDKDAGQARLVRAKNLAARASNRERLFILGGWAYRTSSPALRPIAETLSVRYPTEVEGHLYMGISQVLDGDFLAAVAPLERVISMDDAPLHAGANCAACEAFRWLVSAYELADSLPAAERVARRWVRRQPGSTTALEFLVEAIEWSGRASEADSIARANATYGAGGDPLLDYRAMHLVRTGDYATADRALTAATRIADARRLPDAYWDLAISLRQQGRLAEALGTTRRMRRVSDRGSDGGPPSNAVLEAQLLLEQGNGMASAALLDSLVRAVYPGEPESARARRRVWLMTQLAEARIVARDTAPLDRLADSIRVLGEASGYGRDRRLYHHVLGRLYALRGDDARAIAELRAAIYSPNAGYTRTNYELARIQLRQRRPRDAVAVLQPALRGSIEASNLYVARTEVHELLAQAWDAAGGRDSAAVHYRTVISDWASADPPFVPRVQAARARLAALAR